jgi:hypothetical protein
MLPSSSVISWPIKSHCALRSAVITSGDRFDGDLKAAAETGEPRQAEHTSVAGQFVRRRDKRIGVGCQCLRGAQPGNSHLKCP